jgi:hypothetical protein
MFGALENSLKRNSYILPLALLLCRICPATSAVFIFTPKRIVAGIDRKTNDLSNTGKLVNAGVAKKIALLKGRFAVACIGSEKIEVGTTVAYDFQNWIKRVDSQISRNSSVLTVVDIVERESAKTFKETIPIGSMMRTGAIKHAQYTDKFVAQFVIAGFDHAVAYIVEVNYEYDWEKNRVVGPNRIVNLPQDGTDTGVYFNGERTDIYSDRLVDPNSYAHKRMEVLAPTAFHKILSVKATEQGEAIRAVRALIGIEAECRPVTVGNGSNVAILPSVGVGSVLEFDNSLAEDIRKQNKCREKCC